MKRFQFLPNYFDSLGVIISNYVHNLTKLYFSHVSSICPSLYVLITEHIICNYCGNSLRAVSVQRKVQLDVQGECTVKNNWIYSFIKIR